MNWKILTLAAVLGCGAMLAGCEQKQENPAPVAPSGAGSSPDVVPADVTPPTTGPSATTRPTT